MFTSTFRTTDDVLVDGANVGYYNSSSGSNAPVSLSQIQRVTQHFALRGKRTLIFLHQVGLYHACR
jgi:hypothetical protein